MEKEAYENLLEKIERVHEGSSNFKIQLGK